MVRWFQHVNFNNHRKGVSFIQYSNDCALGLNIFSVRITVCKVGHIGDRRHSPNLRINIQFADSSSKLNSIQKYAKSSGELEDCFKYLHNFQAILGTKSIIFLYTLYLNSKSQQFDQFVFVQLDNVQFHENCEHPLALAQVYLSHLKSPYSHNEEPNKGRTI